LAVVDLGKMVDLEVACLETEPYIRVGLEQQDKEIMEGFVHSPYNLTGDAAEAVVLALLEQMHHQQVEEVVAEMD
jgi:hypothetical protein